MRWNPEEVLTWLIVLLFLALFLRVASRYFDMNVLRNIRHGDRTEYQESGDGTIPDSPAREELPVGLVLLSWFCGLSAVMTGVGLCIQFLYGQAVDVPLTVEAARVFSVVASVGIIGAIVVRRPITLYAALLGCCYQVLHSAIGVALSPEGTRGYYACIVTAVVWFLGFLCLLKNHSHFSQPLKQK
jgi:hypothetical protein